MFIGGFGGFGGGGGFGSDPDSGSGPGGGPLGGLGGLGGIGNGIIGGFVGGAFDLINDKWHRDWAEEQANRQRQWQADMSNTAYQRATVDMRAAGLNPMLAYMQGGASTPSGGTASNPGHSSTGGQVISNALSSVNTGLARTRLEQDINQSRSQIGLNQAASLSHVSSAKAQEAMSDKLKVDAVTSAKQAGLYSAQQAESAVRKQLSEAQIPAVRAESKARATQAPIDQSFQHADAWGDRLRSWLPFLSPRQRPQYNFNLGDK